jgi:hypothetical protein
MKYMSFDRSRPHASFWILNFLSFAVDRIKCGPTTRQSQYTYDAQLG